MRICLTGGTGFIGSHFINQALIAGHSIYALRRSPNSKPRIPLLASPDWFECQMDEVTSQELQGSDVLVHLSAHTGNVPYDNLANCLRWNLNAVLTLFEQARLAGIRRFVVAGSCFEYGSSGERFDAIPTNAPLEPTNSYSASKAAASIALLQWAKEHKVNLEILRVFHAYGEGELDTRFWPSLKRAALSGSDFPMTEGEQIRDFMPVENVALTFLNRASINDTSASDVQVFNLSTGDPTSIRSFAQRCWEQWNACGELIFGQVPYRPGEVMRYVPGDKILKLSSPSYN
ncbi:MULTISPECIES: NAD-dependent epimerase/dehydratase family protein [unclassified Synechococcus]|uniref:NAD-dependent epimerase/dehydratase family protein n=1 Tax=unclassified Synechococcus TaxID=2626047 RepID=UPI0039AF2A23